MIIFRIYIGDGTRLAVNSEATNFTKTRGPRQRRSMAAQLDKCLDDIILKLEIVVCGYCRDGTNDQHSQDILNLIFLFYAKQMVEINEQLTEVKEELSEAKIAVKGISLKQLDEIAFMRKPPVLVEMTMIAACMLLGRKTKRSWQGITRAIRRRDFIPDILRFDPERVPRKLQKAITKKYLSDPEWTYERVNECSKTAGALCQWVRVQVKYAHLLDQVEPIKRAIIGKTRL